jgi:Zn-dependent protease
VSDLYQENPVALASWVFWVIASIVLHELGHGIAAIRSGDRTPIDTGHMTWNPLVHMGPISLLCFAILGFCWGAMPVDPSRFRGRYDEAKVAAAGPCMNFGLAITCAVLYAVWHIWLRKECLVVSVGGDGNEHLSHALQSASGSAS